MVVLIVDDHPLVLEAIGLVVKSVVPGARIHGAHDLDSAIRIAGDAETLDLVLLDPGLPDCNGLEALLRFRALFPQYPVVVVSGASDRTSVLAALDLGAMGFIPKSASRAVMLEALARVASGGIYVPQDETDADRAHCASADQPGAGADRPGAQEKLDFTDRQLDVLRLLVKAMPNKMIAHELSISEHTVKQHVSAVLGTLGVTTRTQAVLAASRLGIRLRADN